MKVGTTEKLYGNVTTLNWIGPRPPREIERNLGYGAGRLSAGYWVVLLKQSLTPLDFEFDGITLRSGGRLGLPGQTASQDAMRVRVHDQAIAQHGTAGYEEMQRRALQTVKLAGAERIAKVVPVTRHADDMPPASQYPPGGGGLQWAIKKARPCTFLVAMHVDATGIATTPTFAASVADGAPYDGRARLMRYLETA
jgi:hypothetical protein